MIFHISDETLDKAYDLIMRSRLMRLILDRLSDC